MCETYIAIEQKLLKMSDREVANCLHRLEQTFLKLSKVEQEFNSHYKLIYHNWKRRHSPQAILRTQSW